VPLRFTFQTNVIIKNHLGHMWWTFMALTFFNFFNSYSKDVIIYVLTFFWYKYQCGYEQEDYWYNLTHIWFIKEGWLTLFLIKRPYTWFEVTEIMIYHKAHTWIDGSFTHGEHDLESISHMFRHISRMSQTLKDHIWTQLSLGYTTK
jgi:hypothetical protein